MSLATPVRDKERLPLRVLGVGGGIEAVAFHFARFCDEGEGCGVAFLDDAFDGVDLLMDLGSGRAVCCPSGAKSALLLHC